MGEREALLRTVCENPDDDLPRLVFADWLDEHGEPERAEFIRIQIELGTSAKRGESTVDSRRQRELRNLEQSLLYLNGNRWRQEVPVYTGVHFHDFSRGFMDY